MSKLSALMAIAYDQWRNMWKFDRTLASCTDIKQVAEYHMSHKASVKRRKNKKRFK